MPTRKATTKTAKKASKARPLNLKAIKAGRMVLYGIPIWDAIKRGNLSEMKQLATLARMSSPP